MYSHRRSTLAHMQISVKVVGAQKGEGVPMRLEAKTGLGRHVRVPGMVNGARSGKMRRGAKKSCRKDPDPSNQGSRN